MGDTVAPFLPDDFTINEKSIFQGELVGKGNFSSVYKGLYLGKYVAVKRQEITDEELERYLVNELAILRFCNHDHIVKYIGAGKPDNKTILSITEFIAGGDLSMLLRGKVEVGWMNKASILWKVADALHYLHSHNIIHRDVKTDNVMLGLDLTPKLIDLGFARVVEEEDSGKTMTCLGTDEYMAPEITFALPYHFPADAFSLGIVIFEVCFGAVPKRTAANGFCIEWEEAKEMLTQKSTPNSLKLLVEQSASDEPHDRLTMLGVSEWLEELVGDLKAEGGQAVQLDEEEVMKRIQARWAQVLKYDGDEEALLKLDKNDLETGFLDENKKDANEEMKLRRQSVNRALRSPSMNIMRRSEGSLLVRDKLSAGEKELLDMVDIRPPTKNKDSRLGRKKKKGMRGISLFRSEVYDKQTKPEETKLKNDIEAPDIIIPALKPQAKSQKAKKEPRGLIGSARRHMFSSGSTTKRRKRLNRKQKKKVDKFPLSKEDFVYKKLQFGFSAWVKEFLVLSEEGLLYFKDKEARKQAKVSGALLFMDMVPQKDNSPAINVSIAQAGKPYCFQVLNKERKIIFQATTRGDKEEWIVKINRGYKAWKAKQKS